MKNFLQFIFVSFPFFLSAQETSTLNITPYSATPVRYEKVIASLDGKDVFLVGMKGNDVVVMQKEGNQWKDISKGVSQGRIKGAASGNESLLWIFTYNKYDGNRLFAWSPKYLWNNNRLHEDISGDIQVFDISNNGDLVFGGRLENKEGKSFAVRRIWKKTEYKSLMPKKVPAEISGILETYRVAKITSGKKEMVYMEMRGPNKEAVIIYGNGKEWEQAGNALKDTAYSMVADDNGNLFLSGNFTSSDGKDCILKWDGKKWTEIPLDGFANGKPKALAIDKNNQLLVGGETKEDYQVMQLDGNNGWQFFGTAPASNGQMAYNGSSIFLIGGANNSSVYMVPRGGKITATTSITQGERKDKKAQEVYELFTSYCEIYPSYYEQITDEWNELSKDFTKEGAAAFGQAATSANYSFFILYRDNLKKLSLEQGDNKLADYQKDLNDAHVRLLYEIVSIAKQTQNMYYDNADWQRDKKYINELMQNIKNLTTQLTPTLNAFVKRNGIAANEISIAQLTPDANTLKIWKRFSEFHEANKKVDGVADKSFGEVLSLSMENLGDALLPKKSPNRDLLKRLSDECYTESNLLYKYKRPLEEISLNLQPAAASFSLSFENYLNARISLLKTWAELGNYLTDTKFDTEQEATKYTNQFFSMYKSIKNATKRFDGKPAIMNKAIAKFKAKFKL